jgi:hypothetical protein
VTASSLITSYAKNDLKFNMTGPTTKRLSELSQIQSEVALVHFLPIRDESDLEGYIAVSATAVSQNNGRRRYRCHIDQILSGGDMAYDALLVDTFPSGEAVLRAFAAGQPPL